MPVSDAYLLAKFGFDTAENEPCKVCPIDFARSSGAAVQQRPLVIIRAVLAGADDDSVQEQGDAKRMLGGFQRGLQEPRKPGNVCNF